MANTAKRIGTDELAGLFRTTRQTIHRWTQAGMPHRMANGTARYVAAECVAWRIDAVREEERSKARPPEEGAGNAELRKMTAEAGLKELALDEKRGELIARDQAVADVEGFVAGFAATAAGELHRFERDIVSAETPAAARRVTDEIHAALMRGAQQFAATLDDPHAALGEAA